MSSTIKNQINEVGLTEVYCSPDPQVDVVLVHGLNGHPYNTWATHEPDVFWPSDLLPKVVEEQHCRILTYGYDANVTAFTDGASKDHIHNHAEHLAARLVANRSVKARERPIIFVAHSLGGLVVKRLLIYCESINNPKLERLRSIYVSTFGILFLGTPHNGSDLAKMGSALQSICAAVLPKKFFDSSPQLVNALRSNNETLQNINRLFIEIIDPFRVYFFHEQKPMDLKGTRQFVVEEDSAAPVMQGVERMGIERDHSHMCKFEDTNAPGFDVVSDAISSYAQEAPSTIRGRWEREKRVREYYRQSMASELLGDSILGIGQYRPPPSGNSTQANHRTAMEAATPKRLLEDVSPTGSYVIEEAGSSAQSIKLLEGASTQSLQKQPRVAPLLFRPNSVFVGFEIELEQLKHKLSSEKKTKIGTCSVLICGPPGSGKSHLARQYVWTQDANYPAGIFWVDCKSKQNMDRYYWDIGQALGCLEGEHSSTLYSDRSFIDEVRKCLESLQGWLIVFDGVFFDSEEALSDFVQYLPDSPGNSIIYTSVDPTLKNRHRLLNPSWIRMRPLSPRAARELLFKSLGMREYNSVQLRKAQELVRYYRCLPLGIHAAAHMLVAQGRALEKFSPATSDQRLANPFLEIVRALETRGYNEAVTLLVLLSLLGHKVPVVLLHLGTPALTEFECNFESLNRAGGVKKDLDNTISVLLRYGLVERELQTCSVSTPEQNKASPQMSRATTAASVAYFSPTVPTLSNETSDLNLIANDESNGSSERTSITIDTLRTHTITQAVVREEAQARGMLGLSYNQWLAVACKFLCVSYGAAANKLGALPGQGSVADYREYKTHIATLWKLLPRSSKHSSDQLSSARENLKTIYRDIQDEIRNRSPSQSQSSNTGHLKYIGSVFETSASSSDEGPPTPTSDLTRESTWTSEKLYDRNESPVRYHVDNQTNPEDAVSELDDDGYATELDDLTSTVQSSQRLSTSSDTTVIPGQSNEGSTQRALLSAILHGHSGSTRKKDLGEFKPMPTLGKVSNPAVETIRPRSVSSSSSSFPWPFRRSTTGSSAEAALVALQAKSTGARIGLSDSKNVLAGSENKERPRLDLVREPLSNRSTNTQLPIVTADHNHLPPDLVSKPQQVQYSRRTSMSPRLVNSVLTRQAARVWDVPVEENISITRRYAAPLHVPAPSGQNLVYDTVESGPTGYMSAPMSRDASRDSNPSLLSVPTEPVPMTNFAGSRYLESYEHQARSLPSVGIAMSRSLESDQIGTWTTTPSFGLRDDMHNVNIIKPLPKTAPTSAPTSAPLSPDLTLRPASQDGDLESLIPDIEGKEPSLHV